MKAKVILRMMGDSHPLAKYQAIGRTNMRPGDPLSDYQFVVTVGKLARLATQDSRLTTEK
jgi:hypothetical protein